MAILVGSNQNNTWQYCPPTMFAHVDVVLELNWFYNQVLSSKETLRNLIISDGRAISQRHGKLECGPVLRVLF
jgi:hypothetical protein